MGCMVVVAPGLKTGRGLEQWWPLVWPLAWRVAPGLKTGRGLEPAVDFG